MRQCSDRPGLGCVSTGFTPVVSETPAQTLREPQLSPAYTPLRDMHRRKLHSTNCLGIAGRHELVFRWNFVHANGGKGRWLEWTFV